LGRITIGRQDPSNWAFGEFLWFGFFEELIYWVSFSVAIGSLAGSVAAGVAKRRMQESFRRET
jgi:hypothetical protein